MKKNPYIRKGLERAGFSGGWLAPEGSFQPLELQKDEKAAAARAARASNPMPTWIDRLRRWALPALAALAMAGCARTEPGTTTVRFWAMGRREPRHQGGCAEHSLDRRAREAADGVRRRRAARRMPARQHLGARVRRTRRADAAAAVRAAFVRGGPEGLLPGHLGYQRDPWRAGRRAVVCRYPPDLLPQGPAGQGRLRPSAAHLAGVGRADGRDQEVAGAEPLRGADADQRVRAAAVAGAAAARSAAARR
ncbi:hypothetical protein G6F22_015817 [Rhizopus arrhizus]|nr:hypothetical protein G6F22_015817 [Rhizopus arrhizus]